MSTLDTERNRAAELDAQILDLKPLATPTLWRAIDLWLEDDGLLDWRLREFDIWLVRSACTPLSIEIDHRENAQDHNVRLLSAHNPRCEFLEIHARSFTIPITAAPMPLLRHLDIASNAGFIASEFDAIITPEMPALRSAILDDNAAATLTLPWAQLTSLKLNRVYPAECVPILQQTTNLVHCQLDLVDGGDTPWPDMMLMRLESLIFSDNSDTVKGYLETFSVPSLRKLHIPERYLQNPVDSLKALMLASGGELRDVRITGERHVSKDTYARVFPSIEFSFDSLHVGDESSDEE
ncbi:hypothetical protein C8R46DRAFT_1285259 [Mycena filopes]|nr:hypothetical protein C8R46DRAFT_1285259 [Mycena filopes]